MCENLKNYVLTAIDKRIEDDTYMITMLEQHHNTQVSRCSFHNSDAMSDVCRKVYVKTKNEERGFFCPRCNKYVCIGCAATRFTDQGICTECYATTHNFNNLECMYCKSHLAYARPSLGTSVLALWCLKCKAIFAITSIR
jgi:hypothetical protein